MRKILLLTAVLFAAFQMSSAPVDLSSAQFKAQQFVQQHTFNGKLCAPISGEMRLAHIERNSTMLDRAAFYIFNTPNGFVVIAGDDRVDPILGYGDYPLDINTIPCNMKALLNMLKQQMEYLHAHQDLVVEDTSLKSPSRIASVEPLLEAKWDQEAPYWNQCVINGYQCLTGCPATSAAMVMHYWKYPDFETPEVPGYRCKLSTGYYSTTNVNVAALPPVTFDWDNMRNTYGTSASSYTAAEANAVATLMRYVGQAERMEYGTSAAGGSGILSDSVSLIVDMYKLFGYDEESVRHVRKQGEYASNDAWGALIQEELAEGRPIVFCAVAGGWFGGGHAFNVDGYDASTNKYHINFGWSGEGNNYFALNSFNGNGSTFNQDQQMVIGIQPPSNSPRLRSDASALSMECYKNHTATASFKLTGRNMEGNVTLSLADENDVFSIDHATFTPDDDNKLNETVNVTYSPKAEGNYTATLIVSSLGVEDIVITLTGVSDYELYRPVMLDLDEETVTATSFRADWSDATPAENVISYTLEVKSKPDVMLLTEADWSNVPQENTNHASDAANYMPDGWTFSGSKLYLDGGFLSASKNSVITANLGTSDYNVVSIIVKAKAYTPGSKTRLTVSTENASQVLVLADDVDTYLVVLEAGADGLVQFTCGNYPEIQSIKIYGGEIVDVEPFALRNGSRGANDEYYLIEGITPDKFYTMTGLTPAATYLYRVKSLYVNGTESAWSNFKEVMLNEQGEWSIGDVNGDGDVNISDVIVLVNYILSQEATGVILGAADCNGDSEVNISDVTLLINYVLNGRW